ncbi:MAG TPA: hypothetical protein VGB52_13875 [Actinomycetota bacterium]
MHTWDDQTINGDGDEPICIEGDVSVDVPVGLDGGQYDFVLTGMGCNGAGLAPNGQGTVVGDPPLGI